jgi:hypothetical protein
MIILLKHPRYIKKISLINQIRYIQFKILNLAILKNIKIQLLPLIKGLQKIIIMTKIICH